jgi:tetratricopeptide (TPR) repeat protein
MIDLHSFRSSIARTRKMTRMALCVALAFPLLLISRSDAQESGAGCSDEGTILGVVIGSDGKPAQDTVVHLDKMAATEGAVTKSDPRGAFVFSSLPFGSYRLSAERSNAQSQTIPVDVSAADCKQAVNLTLKLDGHAAVSVPSKPLEQAMQFADQPNFTIAGVTDWTAAGGHGSDSVLRTSESLASETRNLKADDTGPAKADANEGNVVLAQENAGDLHGADERVHALLKAHPDAALFRVAASLDEKLGDPLASVREYEEATKLDPSEESYFDWGSELLLHRAVWQAQEVLRKGAHAYPNSVRMQTALASALFAGARYDDAALRLCEASNLKPSDPEPYLFMGQIQAAAPDSLHCIESKLQRFAEMYPDSAKANYMYAMAILKRQQKMPNAKDVQRAEILLEKSVTLDSRCGDAYLQLGVIAASRGSYEKAIKFYSDAIKADPQLADAYYRLGVAYDHTSQREQAKLEFELHDRIKREQAEAVERQRKNVKQFVFLSSGAPTLSAAQ